MSEKTKLKKTIEWFENKRIVVILAILLIGLFTVSKVLKTTSEIKGSVKDLRESSGASPAENREEVSQVKTKIIRCTGKVLNEDNTAVARAKIELVGYMNENNLTDDLGNFTLNYTLGAEVKELEVMVSHKSYKPHVQKIALSEDHNINLGRIYLSPKSKNLKRPTGSSEASSSAGNKSSSETTFKNNTFNGPVINNPSGPIEINSQVITKDTARHE